MITEGLKKITKNISTIGLRAKVVGVAMRLCPQKKSKKSNEATKRETNCGRDSSVGIATR